MKRYVKNILIYIAALFGIVAFLCIFSSPLKIYDSVIGRWYNYPLKAYLGKSSKDIPVYKGTVLPIIGFVLPMLMAIVLIVESFKPSWSKSINVVNSILAILYFISAIFILLTKELILRKNNLGDTPLIKNGFGLIMAAVLSTLAGILLLLVTWIPSHKNIDFIEK